MLIEALSLVSLMRFRTCQIGAYGSEAHIQLNIKEKFIMRFFQQGMALSLSWCLLLAGVRDGFAYQTDASISQSPPQAAQQSPEQLQQLVAPIALYPDALIAQILAAATYPSEIVEAERWIEQHKDLKGDKLAKEVNKQSWDASVKALTQFPAVLANMNQNLAWTSELGDAYVNQQQDVTQAIQTMRQRAQQAGNLKPRAKKPSALTDKRLLFNRQVPRWFTYLNTIPGLCMERRLLSSPVGIRFRDFFWTVQESLLDWVSGLGCLPASAGVGTVGDSIGMAGGESSTTATRSSRIAGLSSTAIVFIRVERTSIMRRTFTAVASLVMRERIPAPSVGSTMAGSLEPTPSEDSRALVAPTEAASALAASMEEAGDSSQEVT
jgi:hypothetical protein